MFVLTLTFRRFLLATWFCWLLNCIWVWRMRSVIVLDLLYCFLLRLQELRKHTFSITSKLLAWFCCTLAFLCKTLYLSFVIENFCTLVLFLEMLYLSFPGAAFLCLLSLLLLVLSVGVTELVEQRNVVTLRIPCDVEHKRVKHSMHYKWEFVKPMF